MSFYRALVVDNADPTGQGRVRLQIPQLFGSEVTTWAVPMDFGMTALLPPAAGQQVWASFEGGDHSYPIYLPSLTQALRALEAKLGFTLP